MTEFKVSKKQRFSPGDLIVWKEEMFNADENRSKELVRIIVDSQPGSFEHEALYDVLIGDQLGRYTLSTLEKFFVVLK